MIRRKLGLYHGTEQDKDQRRRTFYDSTQAFGHTTPEIKTQRLNEAQPFAGLVHDRRHGGRN